MNLQTIKKADEIKLAGISAELENRDGSLFSVTLTDANGTFVKVSQGRYSDIQIMAQAPPKKIKKFALTGKLLGIAPFSEQFDDEFAASTRKSELEKQAGYPENFGLEIVPVEVEE